MTEQPRTSAHEVQRQRAIEINQLANIYSRDDSRRLVAVVEGVCRGAAAGVVTTWEWANVVIGVPFQVMPTADLSMKYALFSCLYPIVGCYTYALAALHAISHWVVLFPIPVVLLVVGFGLDYAWHPRTRERIDQLVRGNLILSRLDRWGNSDSDYPRPCPDQGIGFRG